jgi:hypothetical protein
MPDDLLRYYEVWDQKALAAFRYYYQVEQPLEHLIRTAYREKARIAAEQQVLIDSIKTTYYDRTVTHQNIDREEWGALKDLNL